MIGLDYADFGKGGVETKTVNRVAIDYSRQGGLVSGSIVTLRTRAPASIAMKAWPASWYAEVSDKSVASLAPLRCTGIGDSLACRLDGRHLCFARSQIAPDLPHERETTDVGRHHPRAVIVAKGGAGDERADQAGRLCPKPGFFSEKSGFLPDSGACLRQTI
jgi:hypothetical protein